MCILEKFNFKISPGSMSPDLPSVPAPSEIYPTLFFNKNKLNKNTEAKKRP